MVVKDGASLGKNRPPSYKEAMGELTQQELAKLVGRRLRAARERAGLTQQEAGELAGFPKDHAQSRISHYERGFRSATLADLLSLARIYGKDVVSLISEVRETPTEEVKLLEDFRLVGEDTKRHIRSILDSDLEDRKASKKGRSRPG